MKFDEIFVSVKQYLKEHFALIHFAICLGFFAIILTTQLFCLIETNPNDFFGAFSWFLYPKKKIELLSYLITVPVLFMLFFAYIGIYLKIDKIKAFLSNLSEKCIYSLLLFDLIINFVISLKMGKGSIYICFIMFIWLFTLILPFFKAGYRLPKVNETIKNFSKISFFTVVSLFLIFNFVILFKSLVSDKLYIYSEAPFIPSETIIGNKVVDYTSFMEQNYLKGNRKLYDIRTPDKSLDGANCVKVDNLNLKDKLNIIIDKIYFDNQYRIENINNYFYIANNKICSVNPVSESEMKVYQEKLAPKYQNDIQKIALNSQNNKPLPEGKQFDKFFYQNNGEDILIFEKANNQNEVLQHVGYWLNHQNHILSTISQLNLGRNPNNIFMQYGYGTTLLLQKVLNMYHGFNFGDYYHVLNSFYFIYYLALFALIILLFQKPIAIISAIGLILISLNNFWYVHFHIAPGANPIRHFFDIFAVGALYFYFSKNNKLGLLLADLFCIGGIILYPEYGLFLSLAMIAMFIIKQISQKNVFEIFNSVLLLIASLVTFKLFNIGVNYGLDNFLAGLSGFLATKKIINLIYFIVILAYALIIRNLKTQEKENQIYRNLLLFLILYVQGIILYFLTISEITHFLVLAPVYILTLFVFGKLFFATFKINVNTVLKYFLTICIIYFAGKSLYFHENHKSTYIKELKGHPTYEWTMKNANFVSNMNPEYFEDSVKLMQKYSTSPEIYIISQYDGILNLLADKYNAIPYIDLQWYLTKLSIFKDLEKQLKEEKPKYIFVDNTLTMPNMEALVDSRHFRLKLQTYHRMKLMRSLFETVKNDYKPVERSYLLTVWERKDK